MLQWTNRGAGVVGLTLAVAINAFDKDHRVTVDLYEAAPELGEIGAGINVWPKTWEIFKNLGLEEVLVPFFDHEPDLEPRTARYLIEQVHRLMLNFLRSYFPNPQSRSKERVQST